MPSSTIPRTKILVMLVIPPNDFQLSKKKKSQYSISNCQPLYSQKKKKKKVVNHSIRPRRNYWLIHNRKIMIMECILLLPSVYYCSFFAGSY